MLSNLLQKIVRVSLFCAFLIFGITPAVAWTGPTAAPPGGVMPAAPLNISSTAQSKTGYLYINSPATTGYPLTVGAPTGNTWPSIFNWPPASAPAGTYGILVGSSAAGYSQFQNASGYYAALADTSYSFYGNGNIYVAGTIQSGSYVYGPNSFGGGWEWASGGFCYIGNYATGGGCSCPGYAPYAHQFGQADLNSTYSGARIYLCAGQ